MEIVTKSVDYFAGFFDLQKDYSVYHQKYGKVVRRIVTEPLELSSHEVREAIALEKSLKNMVPEAVEAYIREHRLYERAL